LAALFFVYLSRVVTLYLTAHKVSFES